MSARDRAEQLLRAISDRYLSGELSREAALAEIEAGRAALDVLDRGARPEVLLRSGVDDAVTEAVGTGAVFDQARLDRAREAGLDANTLRRVSEGSATNSFVDENPNVSGLFEGGNRSSHLDRAAAPQVIDGETYLPVANRDTGRYEYVRQDVSNGNLIVRQPNGTQRIITPEEASYAAMHDGLRAVGSRPEYEGSIFVDPTRYGFSDGRDFWQVFTADTSEGRALRERVNTENIFGMLLGLEQAAPTLDQLQTGTGDELGDLYGGASAVETDEDLLSSLERFAQFAGGGLTSEELRSLNMQDAAIAQQGAGQRQAMLGQYEQQGLGGSGVEVAAQMGGQQQQLNAQAQMRQAAMLAAQQRALQATSAMGTLAGQRSAAIDAYNQTDRGRRIARQGQNAQAAQQQYGNTERLVALGTNQYQGDTRGANDAAQAGADATQEGIDRTLQFVGGLLG